MHTYIYIYVYAWVDVTSVSTSRDVYMCICICLYMCRCTSMPPYPTTCLQTCSPACLMAALEHTQVQEYMHTYIVCIWIERQFHRDVSPSITVVFCSLSLCRCVWTWGTDLQKLQWFFWELILHWLWGSPILRAWLAGCQLMAAILNLRSLQLRKHALNRILSEPFPGHLGH